MNEGQISYPDKTKKCSQVRIEMIEFSEAATLLVAGVTRGDDDKNLLVMNERLVGLLLIPWIEVEGAPDADNLIDVGLK